MKTIQRKKVMSDREIASKKGTFYHTYDTLFVDSVCVQDDKGKVLALLLKNIIPENICTIARTVYEKAGEKKSVNRGDASGSTGSKKQHRTINFNTNKIFEQDSNEVSSGIMGYIDSSNWRSPCRQTAFNVEHQQDFIKGKPYIEKISRAYKKYVPEAYQKQYEASMKSPNHIIENTVFSTVTVNKNFQTALHVDRGDFIGGFGNISVVERGSYDGGYTVMPQYGIAFDVRQGDVLFLDVHKYHCNTPITLHTEDSMRLSFVCYLRRNMHKCDSVDPMINVQKHLSTNQKMWHMLTGDPSKPIPTSLPTCARRTSLGKGNFGHEWYQLKSPYATFQYHNKRYTATLRHKDRRGALHETSYDPFGCITKSYYDFLKKAFSG
jgi:hypothetical protein